jgi:hypothetical protein
VPTSLGNIQITGIWVNSTCMRSAGKDQLYFTAAASPHGIVTSCNHLSLPAVSYGSTCMPQTNLYPAEAPHPHSQLPEGITYIRHWAH